MRLGSNTKTQKRTNDNRIFVPNKRDKVQRKLGANRVSFKHGGRQSSLSRNSSNIANFYILFIGGSRIIVILEVWDIFLFLVV